MSLSFIKRAFSLKRNSDEQHIEDFLKWYHVEGFFSISQLSKIFRKSALRLIVIGSPSESVIFDSSLVKDQTRLPVFGKGENRISLSDIAFGSFSLNSQKDLKSAIKLHDIGPHRQVILTYVYYPTSRRVRTTNSISCSKIKLEKASVDLWSNKCSSLSPDDLAVAICVLVNVDWARPLAKSTSSGFSFSLKQSLPIDLAERFYALIFDHFLQISVSFQTLAEMIGHLTASSGMSRQPQKLNFNEFYEKINLSFIDFQRNFRDLCIPRLCRPVWPSLSLAYVSQSATPTGSRRMPGKGPNIYQKFPLDITPLPAQYKLLSNSFVRGCLCSLISKNMSKDRCQFLAQLVTGVLMQHRGWISTVMLEIQNSCAESELTVCEALGDGFTRVMTSGGGMENSLSIQYLVQSGCDLNRHSCEDANILNRSGTALATTIIYGSAPISGLQQQHRDRLLALLYLCSYFLRPPHFLLQSHEQLPDLSVADLYELDQRKQKSLPRPRSSSGSSSRRKSSSQLSASLMVGQRSGVVDIHDSGIASQEDLSAAMLHTLQQYSSSAGSSPSHPPVGSSAICLPGRLTSEQCRLAEAAAHALVSREFAAAATAKSLQQTQQPQQPNILQCPPIYGDVSGAKSREHTWTTGVTGRNRKMFGGFLAASSSVSDCGGAKGVGANTNNSGEIRNAAYSSVSPNVSTGVPSFSASISHNLTTDLTEVPLLIEKWYDCDWGSCWCLGEGIGLSVLGSNYRCGSSGTRAAVTEVAVRHGSSVERYSSLDNDDYVEVGTVCCADMESSDDGAQDTGLGSCGGLVGGGPELTLHSPIGASVLDHYTSGLALQATTESPISFRGRLMEDLTSWLLNAPTLLRRAVAPPPCLRPSSCTQFTNQLPPPACSAFQCSALLVNVDISNVEMLIVKDSVAKPVSKQRRSRSKKRSNGPLSPESPLSLFLPPVAASTDVAKGQVIAESDSDSSSTGGCFDGPKSQTRTVISAPSVLRLLETVRLIYEKSGECSSLALQHLETGLQNICVLGNMLADLLVPSITSPDSGPDTPCIFKKNPEVIANILGCHSNDLPLLLTIAGSVSCKAAAVIKAYDLDQMW